MKKYLILCLIPLLMLSLWFPAAAEFDLLVDEGDWLSDAQEAELEALLLQMTDRNAFDIAVRIVSSCNGASPEEVAQAAFIKDGLGKKTYGGVLLLLDMEKSEDYLYVQQAPKRPMLPLEGRQKVHVAFDVYVEKGEPEKAIRAYATTCDEVVTTMRLTGELSYVRPLEWYYIPIALGIGMLLAAVPVLRLCGRLQVVRQHTDAKNYLREDSLRVTEQSESYLHDRVAFRTPRSIFKQIK
ncbi:MAG: TPM domain-containing protein [Clostridia bacterium]|nr:TPM domain-containing protein [Clostridia bacterium]